MSVVDFPGETARASLKLGRASRRVQDGPVNFPGETARASLKRHDPVQRAACPTLHLFPGRNGPGLIEAMAAPAVRGTRGDRFPGRNGPGLIEAQTIEPKVSHDDEGLSEFPGRNGPGLIEASSRPFRSGLEHVGYFPGETARASLKPLPQRSPLPAVVYGISRAKRPGPH